MLNPVQRGGFWRGKFLRRSRRFRYCQVSASKGSGLKRGDCMKDTPGISVMTELCTSIIIPGTPRRVCSDEGQGCVLLRTLRKSLNFEIFSHFPTFPQPPPNIIPNAIASIDDIFLWASSCTSASNFCLLLELSSVLRLYVHDSSQYRFWNRVLAGFLHCPPRPQSSSQERVL
jgi:hypothetical protein